MDATSALVVARAPRSAGLVIVGGYGANNSTVGGAPALEKEDGPAALKAGLTGGVRGRERSAAFVEEARGLPARRDRLAARDEETTEGVVGGSRAAGGVRGGDRGRG